MIRHLSGHWNLLSLLMFRYPLPVLKKMSRSKPRYTPYIADCGRLNAVISSVKVNQNSVTYYMYLAKRDVMIDDGLR